MKILFVLPRMVTGGVERITLSLVKELQQRGHECAFALRKAHGEFLPETEALCSVYEIAAGGLHQFVPKLSKLIRTWQPSHIVTAFADIGFLSYLAIKHSGLKLIWLHGVHATHDIITAQPNFIGHLRFKLDNFFAAVVYKKANKIIAVSNGVRQDIINNFKCSENKVVTIYNPVLENKHLVPQSTTTKFINNPPKIIALGRLSRQKGFDILIQAMQKVPQPWNLEIWGDGEERQKLQYMIDSLGLTRHVILKGNTDEPFKIINQADLFVSSSRYEGFGLAIVEALSCGKTIISTNCPHGPQEILENGRWGTLVENENVEALADAITENLNNKIHIPSNLFIERAQAFTKEVATDQWENVLKNLKDTTK